MYSVASSNVKLLTRQSTPCFQYLWTSIASFRRITSKTGLHNGVQHVSLIHPPAIPLRLRAKALVRWSIRSSCIVLNKIKTFDRKDESAKSVLRHVRRRRSFGPHHDRGEKICRHLYSFFKQFPTTDCRVRVCGLIVSPSWPYYAYSSRIA